MTAPTDHLDCARLAQLLQDDLRCAYIWQAKAEQHAEHTARAHLTLHTLAGAMGYDLTRKEKA